MTMRRAENHDAVFDGQRVEMIEHDGGRFRKQRRIASHVGVFVEDHFQQVRRQHRRTSVALRRFPRRHFLGVTAGR